MGNLMDGDKLPKNHSKPHESSSGPDLLLDFLTSSSDNIGKAVNHSVDDALSGEGLLGAGSRVAYVAGTGAIKSIGGFGNAVWHDVAMPEHYLETAAKVGTALSFGVGMRFLLPKAGAAKAIIGGIMGVSFVKDALTPGMEAWSAAVNGKSRKDLNKAADKMGDGYGMFALDSAVGIYAGMKGEHAYDWAVGTKHLKTPFSKWESWKGRTMGGDKSVIGQVANSITSKVDQVAMKGEQQLINKRDEIQLEEIAKKVAHLDQLAVKGQKRQEARIFFEGEGAVKDTKPKSGDKSVKSPVAELPVEGPDKAIFDSSNVDKIGKLREELQNARSLEQEKWDEIQNDYILPNRMSVDQNLKAPLSPAYDHSARQLDALHRFMTNEQRYNRVRDIADIFRQSNIQLTAREPDTIDLNNYARDAWLIFVRGLTVKGNVPAEKLGRHLPPTAAKLATNDGPRVYPSQDGVIDRDALVMDMDSHVEIDAAAGGHELRGHLDIFNRFARFDIKARDKRIKEIARHPFDKLGMEDKKLFWNTGEPFTDSKGRQLKESELFENMLKAQDDENTSDINGLIGQSGTIQALQYDTLVRSWSDGKLRNSSYISDVFADGRNPLGLEVHNFDKERLKAMAIAAMKAAPGNKEIANRANAIINNANKACEPGDKYRYDELKEEGGRFKRTGRYLEFDQSKWSACNEPLVEAQLFDKLEVLNGMSVFDSAPSLEKIEARNYDLARTLADAVAKNKDSLENFAQYKEGFNQKHRDEVLGEMNMVDVMNAGLLALSMSMADGLAEKEAFTRLKTVHSWLRSQFRDLPSPALPVDNSPVKAPPAALGQRFLDGAITTAQWLRRYPETGVGQLAGATSAIHVDELMRQHRLKKELESQQVQ